MTTRMKPAATTRTEATVESRAYIRMRANRCCRSTDVRESCADTRIQACKSETYRGRSKHTKHFNDTRGGVNHTKYDVKYSKLGLAIFLVFVDVLEGRNLDRKGRVLSVGPSKGHDWTTRIGRTYGPARRTRLGISIRDNVLGD